MALARAGHEAVVIGVLAQDSEGDACLAQAQAAGLDTRRVVRREGPAARP
uniref:Uncharacterized protein n=1 Tax=Phenylobacterium glaciei TaxID=2803784 RepID=A0A974P4Z7_9CAUL|nr:hypothetical protein JKL49_08085 [Phenylobacterium glaciei]